MVYSKSKVPRRRYKLLRHIYSILDLLVAKIILFKYWQILHTFMAKIPSYIQIKNSRGLSCTSTYAFLGQSPVFLLFRLLVLSILLHTAPAKEYMYWKRSTLFAVVLFSSSFSLLSSQLLWYTTQNQKDSVRGTV